MANPVQSHGTATAMVPRPEPSSTDSANPAEQVQNHMREISDTRPETGLADLPKKKKLSHGPMSDIGVTVANTQHYLDYILGRLSTETEAVEIQERGSRHARIAAKSRKTGKKL